MKENNKLMPFSYLVLYAKGWIRFPWIKDDENKIWNELKTVLRMDGYYHPNKKDIVSLCLIVADSIAKFYKDNNVHVPFGFKDFYEFYREAFNNAQYYKETNDVVLIIVRHILSTLKLMKTHDFMFKNVDYKKYKLKTCASYTSTTYTECQKRFDKMFKDRVVENEYEKYWDNLKEL